MFTYVSLLNKHDVLFYSICYLYLNRAIYICSIYMSTKYWLMFNASLEVYRTGQMATWSVCGSNNVAIWYNAGQLKINQYICLWQGLLTAPWPCLCVQRVWPQGTAAALLVYALDNSSNIVCVVSTTVEYSVTKAMDIGTSPCSTKCNTYLNISIFFLSVSLD